PLPLRRGALSRAAADAAGLEDRPGHVAVRHARVGLRRRLRDAGSRRDRPARARTRDDADRHRGDLRTWSQRANRRYGTARPEWIPYATAHDRIVIAHSPLARGLLSARYDATHRPRNLVRRRNPLFSVERLDRASGLFTALREVAAVHDATPAQVALAWTIRHDNVVAIVGASSVAQVEENAA